MSDHRDQIPQWFPIDNAKDAFTNTYPFHPVVLSVFERKWQALPGFQRTRGVLQLLALWVSRAYQDGYKGAHQDSLIGLGTAPLDDPIFRSALFEQLGEDRLEGAVTTDINGRKDSHAIRLDADAVDTVKKARLHTKTVTAIFFESNGGQIRENATISEIRLAVAEPNVEIGHIDTIVEALGSSCYFLTVEGTRYRFSLSPNLNKLLADRRGNIQATRVDDTVRAAIQNVFTAVSGVERVFPPELSSQIPDRPVLTLAILPPERSMQDRRAIIQLVDSMTKDHGTSSRTFKSAVIWCVADNSVSLSDEARKVLAWEDINDEKDDLRLDDTQKRQIIENLKKARRDLKEAVWRAYKTFITLGKDNNHRVVDLGLVHSSAADSMVNLILNRLQQDGDLEKEISPNFLIRHWPPAFTEWSTKKVRDDFFASPQFPRLLRAESIRDTVAKGVANGILAYVGKAGTGVYEPFHFESDLNPNDVELSDDMFVITAEEAKKHVEPPVLTSVSILPQQVRIEPGKRQTFTAKGMDQHDRDISLGEFAWTATGGTIGEDGVFLAGPDEGNFNVSVKAGGLTIQAEFTVAIPGASPPPTPPAPSGVGNKLSWSGEIPPQKWMNYYMKVLAEYATEKDLKLTVAFEVTPEAGTSAQKIEETKAALRELGLNDNLTIE